MCASCSHVEKAFHKYKDLEKGVFPKIPTYYIKEQGQKLVLSDVLPVQSQGL